jgi:Ca-activated chloride channel family protein
MVRLPTVIAVLVVATGARGAELPGQAGMYTPQQAALAMLDSEIDVSVRGAIVEATVTQTFRNDTDHATEATYIFPLPLDAAVTAMSIATQSGTIHAAIETRRRAAERYERAIAAGASAALLDEERPDVFTQTVSAIPAHSVVQVTLRYDTTARYRSGQWELALPLVVAPRFVPGSATGRPTTGTGRAPDTDRTPDASRVTPAAAPSAGGKTAIHVHFDGDVTDLSSPTHALERMDIIDPHSDHDAVIRWRAKLPHSAWVEADGFAAVVVEAPAPVARTGALHGVLVLDRSATTRGDGDATEHPLVYALLDALTPADRFAVAGTDTLDARAPDDLRRALDAMWPRAAPTLDLTHTLRTLERTRDPIVLVTDGLVADDTGVIAAARRLASPVHVLGIGPAPNRSLLARIAAVTGGTVRFVAPGDPLPELARDVLADVASPPAPLAITWGTLDASDVVPATMPRLGAHQAALVLARVRSTGSANARVGGDVFGFSAVTGAQAPGAITSFGPLGRRWAREKLDDLVAAGNAKAIAAHALRYGLVSPQTSMVAIADDVIAPGGVKHTQSVPVSVPAGMRWQLVEPATRVDTARKESEHIEVDHQAPRASSISQDDDGVEEQRAKRKPKGTGASKDRPRKASAPRRDDDDDGGDHDDDDARAKLESHTDALKKTGAKDDQADAKTLSSPAPAESEEITVAAEPVSVDRRHRVSVAVSSGVSVVRGHADVAGILTGRLELAHGVTEVGIEGSGWLVGGLHGEGSLLATASRAIARRLELGIGAGLHVTGSALGPALDLALRVPLTHQLRFFLRYDGALLVHEGIEAQHTGTAGFETSW